MSYNAVLLEMINEGPHHMSPFMLLLHAFARERAFQKGERFLAVELGTNMGNSTVALATGIASIGGGVLHTYDIIDCAAAQQYIYRAGCQPFVKFFTVDSVQAAAPYESETVHLLFIDTSHEKEHTWRELGAWLSKVAPGGIIILHDTCSRPEGVGQPMEQFASAKALPHYNIAVDCGLGVILKP